MQVENRPLTKRSAVSKQDKTSSRAAQKGKRRQKRSTQKVLQYEAITEAGVCWLGGDKYSMSLALSDIDYQAAPEVAQKHVVENYAQLLNGFDSDQSIQISVVNRFLDKEAIAREVEIAPRGDELDGYRRAVNSVIEGKLARGRNNTTTDKYLTVTVTAESYDHAKVQLARLEAQITAQLRELGGCRGERLSGEGRVEVLQSILRPGSPFNFSHAQLLGSNLTTKDFVAPSHMDFSAQGNRAVELDGGALFQVLALRDLPRWLSDRLISEISEINTDLVISVHYRPINQVDGLELVRRQIAGMEMNMIREQEKARKRGYSEDLIPHDLKASKTEADDLLHQLEQSNEKLFQMTLLVGVRGRNVEDLAEQVERVRVAARKRSCTFEDLRYMQEDALNAVLPLGGSRLPIFRTVTTATAAILIPFTSQEIMDPDGLYYGVNQTSKNLIVGSRALSMNGNAFFLGTTGSGKSQFAKFELTQVILGRPNDEVIIVDPEREYQALGQVLGASRIEIGTGSNQSVNPLALSRDEDSDEGSPIKRKAEFVLSMCEVLVGGSTGLSPQQRSIVDRCATAMYSQFWNDKTAPQPTLLTFYQALRSESSQEAQDVANGLELYATGSFDSFAKETNVDTSNRFTIYDIARLGSELKTFGLLVVLEAIWDRVWTNRKAGKRTWIYVDEFHIVAENEEAAKFVLTMIRRLRKYGGYFTGMTQNVQALLESSSTRLMLANAAMLALLNQEPTDADELQDMFKLSDKQREALTNLQPGCGTLKLGAAMVPFDDRIPSDNPLYKLFTTKFGETGLQ